ncbi:class I SAM-dependent methyltransferase [Methylovirgula sp. 4M-Z18]|uniref:class I SAM-dependent methyltransferase n=1 Tax=Methylovirgula sp. 4M-Z18 TaxID=2293567 RepID=UPI000E2E70DF|nr:SAM-dependent methyltransferase [Methylovirgula sp. 4M-Z18]RFB78381.1 class I SAM-dependent methyltransferase [Methylovirgula sp. 4M-Z18]
MSEVQSGGLRDEIRAIIAHDGPISLEHYMSLALGHPKYGYYITRDPLGARGDFITAPEISQMFGELLGLWAVDMWDRLDAPPHVKLIELGPGRGTLMQDALRAAKIAPEFIQAASVHFVETSPVLRAAQEETMRQAGVLANWHDDVSHIPQGPAIILANEFFDALPVRHFVRVEDGWRERLVGLGEEGELIFGLAATPEPLIDADVPEGEILEVGAIGYRLMTALADRIATQGGAALIIDYGHTRTQTGETLQAMKAHDYVDPLAEPGEADLTTHVDFAALVRAANAKGANVLGPVTQHDFLVSLGIRQRADILKRRANPAQAADVDSALERLTATGETDMGNLFKVLAVTQPSIQSSPGFEIKDDLF